MVLCCTCRAAELALPSHRLPEVWCNNAAAPEALPAKLFSLCWACKASILHDVWALWHVEAQSPNEAH